MKNKIIRYNSLYHKIAVLTLPYLWIVIFYLMPLIMVAAISISKSAYNLPPYESFITYSSQPLKLCIAPIFENFGLIFNDSLYINAYLNSFKLAFLTTMLCLFLGYPIAYGIANAPRAYQSILIILLVVPFWTSLLVRIYSWINLFKTSGIMNTLLLKLGIISTPIEILNTELAVVIGMSYSYLPFMILPIYTNLIRINSYLIEAAQDLGCTPFSAFKQITFPLSLTGIITGCMLVLIPAIGEFVIPEILGGYKILTIGKLLWNEFFLNHDWPTASAVTIFMMVLLSIPVILLNKAINIVKKNTT